MAITTISSREFNQDLGRAKRAASAGPVVVTERGEPSFVLLKFTDYQKLGKPERSIAEALSCPEIADIEFDLPPRTIERHREIDLD
jgi:prevent-host-death family protein